MKKKKIILLIFGIFILFTNVKGATADEACNVDAAKQLAKIIYFEVGGDVAKNPDENFFMRLTTGSVVLNNAGRRRESTWYSKIYNLTNQNYDRYSTYKDKSFEAVVPENRRGEMLYIAELILTGKYTLPSNMIYQASRSIVTSGGKIWTYVATSGYDVYFGYSKYDGSLSKTDILGNSLSNTSPEYYRNLANDLKLSDYSKYTTSTVCSGLSNGSGGSGGSGGGSNIPHREISIIEDACTDADILRVIYFFTLIIDIAKIAVPIGLVIFGMIDFSKSIIASDDGAGKKNTKLFFKRILCAILLFAVPWIVKVVIINLGNLAEGVNFTDCLENANSKTIEAIENGTYENLKKEKSKVCYYCTGVPNYKWSNDVPSETCNGGSWQVNSSIKSQSSCEPQSITVTFKQTDETVIGTRNCMTSGGGSSCKVTSLSDLIQSKPGYTFTGWSKLKNCKSNSLTSDISVSEDTTYYACYKKN